MRSSKIKQAEEAAWMTAMDSATRNAGELIDVYFAVNRIKAGNYYHRTYMEIISGAEAL